MFQGNLKSSTSIHDRDQGYKAPILPDGPCGAFERSDQFCEFPPALPTIGMCCAAHSSRMPGTTWPCSCLSCWGASIRVMARPACEIAVSIYIFDSLVCDLPRCASPTTREEFESAEPPMNTLDILPYDNATHRRQRSVSTELVGIQLTRSQTPGLSALKRIVVAPFGASMNVSRLIGLVNEWSTPLALTTAPPGVGVMVRDTICGA